MNEFEVIMSIYVSVFWGMIIVYGVGASWIIYAILRWRDGKQQRRDPQLGVKFGLHVLLTVSVLVLVSGASMVAADQFRKIAEDENMSSPNDRYEYDEFSGRPRRSSSSISSSAENKFLTPATRAGFAMMLAGVLLGGGEWYLIFSRTNDLKWPSTRRAFIGARTILHGLIVTGALTGLLIAAFMEKDPMSTSESIITRQVMYALLGTLAVWSLSLVVHMSLLFAYTRQPDVPGENYRCRDCAEDLRPHLASTAIHNCPTCKAAIPAAVRRAHSQPHAGIQTGPVTAVVVGPPSPAATPAPPPSAPESKPPTTGEGPAPPS